MIIGIAGTIGSGKGTVVEYLKSKGFVSYSSSALLGELVVAEGNPKIREFLSKMATKLQEEYPGGVVEKNYQERYLNKKPERAIFESIHRQTEANFIRSIGGLIIGVDADLETRFHRTKARNEGEKDHGDFEDFKKQSYVEDEGGGDSARDNNIRSVINSADYTIYNNGTLAELEAATEAFLAQYDN